VRHRINPQQFIEGGEGVRFNGIRNKELGIGLLPVKKKSVRSK
jgi:hypothetical protein